LKPVRQQLLEGMDFHRRRYRRAKKYMAYFQAFSNTYAPLRRLRELYSQALETEEIEGIVIGTRPDCIDEEILDMLASIAGRKHVMIEYGIESVYNETLKRVNRGHTFEDAAEAVRLTAGKGIHTGAHLIFGLPGEDPAAMLESADIISQLPLTNIKFHQLQIFRGTPLEAEFRDKPGDFHLFTIDSYLEFMVSFIERLNPSFAVERIAGETPPRFAVHRPWGPRYDVILTGFEKKLEERDTWQGRHFKTSVNLTENHSCGKKMKL
jgi:radical SAM protein (TIGR01212 family)